MVIKKKIKRGARKKFFEVKIPLTATKIHLYGYSPEDLEGCVIKLDLTKSLRGKSLELRAKVKLKGEKLTGDLTSLQLMPSYIKRVMRRGTDYVEDSFEVTCKDAKLQIKPFMITRKKVSRAIRKTIRETARKYLTTYIRIRNSEELFSEIMTNKLQRALSLKIKKIYPLALCEIRFIKVKEKIEKPLKKANKENNKEKEEKSSDKTSQKEDKK
ncbi:MAG: hypothetical protein IIA87_00635 [Nanoarchaeota archaeon]|nr:hypothetical protein [Nanoarchaeota archaeon]